MVYESRVMNIVLGLNEFVRDLAEQSVRNAVLGLCMTWLNRAGL